MNIPKAPALGLLLEQPQFESYNRKIAQQNAQIEKKKKASASAPAADETPSKTSVEPTADDAEDDSNAIRDPVEYTTFEQQVEDFKRDVVYKNMHEEEERDDTYGKWLNLHDSQIGTDFDYLNAKGVIRKGRLGETRAVNADVTCHQLLRRIWQTTRRSQSSSSKHPLTKQAGRRFRLKIPA